MVRIQYEDLQIGTISNSSAIFHGSNKQWHYKHHAKQNQAFGTVNGKQCFVFDFHASLRDCDQFDSYSIIKPQKM